MRDTVLSTLRLNERTVAEYHDGGGLEPGRAPRPYLHPVRTLGGVLVTDAQPADHPWHLGVSVGLQDVAGWNFWGGPTYRRDQGYVWLDDHGQIEHVRFTELDEHGFDEHLRWIDGQGQLVLTEHRHIRADLAERGWQLEFTSSLSNPTSQPRTLGSPATNGRTGAGYGGLFWRLPPTHDPHVRTARAAGEHAVHGSVAPWLAWTDRTANHTVAIAPTDSTTASDPWFVRVADYPGIGSQLAAQDPVVLSSGAAATRGLHALVADGVLDEHTIAAWANGRDDQAW